jgi:shikimate dehydrogenase
MKSKALSFGLIGHPLGHSLSPIIHNTALNSLELAGEYRLYPVLPLPEGRERLEELLHKMRTGEINGLNVTIPHKQSVIPLLDDLTTTARSIGAVNTIVNKEKRIIGENTDAPGFLTTLSEHIPAIPSDRTALILGAGGSARAIVYALKETGWQVTVAARRIKQSRELIQHYSSQASNLKSPATLSGTISRANVDKKSKSDKNDSTLNAIHFSQIGEFCQENIIHLVVNTTPVGMLPLVSTNPWPDGIPLPEDSIIYDLVYNPTETAFLRAARSARFKGMNGLSMLIEQAALAFELWSGQTAPRDIMLQAVVGQLAEK